MNNKAVHLAILFSTIPDYAFADENGQEVVIFGTLAMLVLAGIVIFFGMKAEEAANDPTDANFAQTGNLQSKLAEHLDQGGLFDLAIVRQSGNIERTIASIGFIDLVRQIQQTMIGAKIQSVSIRGTRRHLNVYRTMHNGRGRQEGKRIGGFEIRLVGTRQDFSNGDDLNESLSQLFDEAESFADDIQIRIHPKNEAQKAIVKAFFGAYESFDDSPKAIVTSFDKDTGEGDGWFHFRDVFYFLIISDGYLSGEAPLTQDVRKQLAESKTEWQRLIAEDPGRKKVIGAMSFGSTDLHSIQNEMRIWWSEFEEINEKYGKGIMPHLAMKPKILGMTF